MGRIHLDPSADDDQAVADTKNHFGHGLLGRVGWQWDLLMYNVEKDIHQGVCFECPLPMLLQRGA
ncbi:MAG: hypothetical protein EBR23_01615 [Planctomycetia bacterium]|jgi:hypothetical protein|nr:hypothetical protein [Planctomycetia bacterium]